MKKKKVLIIIISTMLALILLFPSPVYVKDGGTVEYTALLYKVSYVHTLALPEDVENGKRYYEGIRIYILGFKIYDSVE